jgi:uncharacterized membrane protein YhaH (DUF805 family)
MWKNYFRDRQNTDDNVGCLRLKIHDHNMQYKLPFHCDSCYQMAPQGYVYTFIVCCFVYGVAVVTGRLHDLESSNEVGIILSG